MASAFLAKDWPSLASALLDRTEVDGDCLRWVGRAKPGKKGGKPYPLVKLAKRTYAAHRLMMRAALDGADLGSMPVHHKCANTLCINPDHLQLVTPAENTAEMLERHAYVRRIAELESALAELAPSHALLG